MVALCHKVGSRHAVQQALLVHGVHQVVTIMAVFKRAECALLCRLSAIHLVAMLAETFSSPSRFGNRFFTMPERVRPVLAVIAIAAQAARTNLPRDERLSALWSCARLTVVPVQLLRIARPTLQAHAPRASVRPGL